MLLGYLYSKIMPFMGALCTHLEMEAPKSSFSDYSLSTCMFLPSSEIWLRVQNLFIAQVRLQGLVPIRFFLLRVLGDVIQILS